MRTLLYLAVISVLVTVVVSDSCQNGATLQWSCKRDVPQGETTFGCAVDHPERWYTCNDGSWFGGVFPGDQDCTNGKKCKCNGGQPTCV